MFKLVIIFLCKFNNKLLYRKRKILKSFMIIKVFYTFVGANIK